VTTPEGLLKAAVRDAARSVLGDDNVWNQPAGQHKVSRGYLHCAPKGAWDLTGIDPRSGRRVEIETKTFERAAKKTPEDEGQRAWGERMRAQGAICMWVVQGKHETLLEVKARVRAELQALTNATHRAHDAPHAEE